MSIKEHVMDYSEFIYYRDSQLWYRTMDTKFVFPVPIEDVGTATFNQIEKSLIMMRYIRKWIERIQAEKP